MTTVLCTIYNSLYLDKGLVLYDSLNEYAKDFKLYVLCMDDKCYEVLTDLHQEHHFPIRLKDFEADDEELLKAKGNRSFGEYCWTCTPSIIRYVIEKYNEPICTYIDADMFFYNDPQILVDEMLEAGKSVMVTPHRFPEERKIDADIVGEYCVEFNTFKNDNDALKALEYWRGRCLECCSNLGDGIHWGDQKYLEEIVDKFEYVHACHNNGAGVAPWNIMLYSSPSPQIGVNTLCFNQWGKDIPLIFFHFQSVKYLSRQLVDSNIKTLRSIDFSLVDSLYYPYLRKIEVKKQMLECNYGINYLIKHHPSDLKIPIWKKLIKYINPRKIYRITISEIKNIHPYIIDLSNEN